MDSPITFLLGRQQIDQMAKLAFGIGLISSVLFSTEMPIVIAFVVIMILFTAFHYMPDKLYTIPSIVSPAMVTAQNPSKHVPFAPRQAKGEQSIEQVQREKRVSLGIDPNGPTNINDFVKINAIRTEPSYDRRVLSSLAQKQIGLYSKQSDTRLRKRGYSLKDQE